MSPSQHFQLYSVYPNMAMVLGLETVKPPNLDIIPTSANFTIPGQVKVYVQDSKSNTTVLAFTLGSVSIKLDCSISFIILTFYTCYYRLFMLTSKSGCILTIAKKLSVQMLPI